MPKPEKTATPNPLVAKATPEPDGSVLIEGEEDGSVVLVDETQDYTPCGVMHPTIEHMTCNAAVGHDGEHMAISHMGAGDFETYAVWGDPEEDDEEVAPAEICGAVDGEQHCILAPGHDGQHYAKIGDGSVTWSDLPGSVDKLFDPIGRGDPVEAPEPQFGPPASVTETAEVQGAYLGVDPSPLRDAQTGQQPAYVPPTQATSGAVLDTTEDSFVPPGAESYVPDNPSRDSVVFHDLELGRLADFLAARFPDELGRTNRQEPESTVDVTIRLLSQFHASSPNAARCRTAYCNKPQGHQDAHGWVNYS